MKVLVFILVSAALASDSAVDSKFLTWGTEDFLRIKEKYLNLFKPLVATEGSGSGIEIDTSEITRVIPKDGFFNYFIPAQKKAMNKLVRILKGKPLKAEVLRTKRSLV